jgi:hypothetical protein
MGGRGSGQLWRWDRQTSLNECLSIDVRDFKRRNLLRAGLGFSWYWSINDQPTGSIGVRAHQDRVVLSYTYGQGDGRRGVEETVWLCHTKCHLGGQRVWFTCPGCHDRVAKLYLLSAYFRCRTCRRLPYACQQETPHDRALRQAQKLRRKLGASPAIGDPMWDKPKGMHWHTFERLKDEVERRDDIANIHLMRHMITRFGWQPS